MADKNPWSPEHWNLTAQSVYTNQYGAARAAARAVDAGTTLGAPAPENQKTRKYLEGSYVFQREIVEE